MSRFLKLLLAAGLSATPALAEGLGRAALPDEIAAWDIDVRPDGLGLPEGGGTVSEGEAIYADQCASCHGDFGESVGRLPVLAGGFDTLATDSTVRTVGSYWPYLSTVWDYVQRTMPYGNAQSLGDDETFAVVAYLMFINDLVDDEKFELTRDKFTDVRLVNEAAFFMDDRATSEVPEFSATPCMTACKDSVEITARIATPELTPGGRELRVVVAAAPDPDLVAAGAKLFRKCKSCHQIGEGAKNKTGPALTNVVGRDAGSVAGFRYSKGMQAAAAGGLIWTRDTLGEFLTKPKTFIPKTKMSFRGFKKATDRTAIIAYLQSQTE